jgi:uncharacterized membrane protein
MTRLLLSIASGLVLVTAYMIVVAGVFILSGENMQLLPYLDLPLRLPKALFFYLFPPTAEDFTTQKSIVFASFAYIGNVVLYAIPAYALIDTYFTQHERS